jgi:hypothetical protein
MRPYPAGFWQHCFYIYPVHFDRFKYRIREIGEDEMVQAMGSLKRTIYVTTPCQGINILLNPFELARLNDMLDLADTEWKAFQLPDLFEVHDGEKI